MINVATERLSPDHHALLVGLVSLATSAPLVERTVPLHLKSTANTRPGHWSGAAKPAKALKRAGFVFFGWKEKAVIRANLEGGLVVRITRRSPKRLDNDNATSAAKNLRDGLAIALGLPINKKGHAEDSDPRVTWLPVDQEKSSKPLLTVEIYRRAK